MGRLLHEAMLDALNSVLAANGQIVCREGYRGTASVLETYVSAVEITGADALGPLQVAPREFDDARNQTGAAREGFEELALADIANIRNAASNM